MTDVAKPMVNMTQQPTVSNQQKLELAKRLASKINMQKNLGPEAQDITQQAAAAILRNGGIAAPQVSVCVSAVLLCSTIIHIQFFLLSPAFTIYSPSFVVIQWRLKCFLSTA